MLDFGFHVVMLLILSVANACFFAAAVVVGSYIPFNIPTFL